jgi:MFS family permease
MNDTANTINTDILTKSVFYAPFSSLMLASLSAGFFTTFLTVYLSIIKASQFDIGMAQSGYYLGMLIGSLTTERQIVKLGHVRAYSVYISIAGTSILLLSLLKDNVAMWIVCRAILGYCLAGIYVVIEGWFLALSNTKNRGLVLTLYTAALYGSSAMGQFFLKLFDNTTDTPFIVSSIIWSLAVLPVLLTTKKIPTAKPVPKLNIRKIFANDKVANLGCIISGVTLSVIYSYGPSYAQIKQVDVSMMMFIIIMGGTLLPLLFGKISDMVDRRLVIVGFCLLSLPLFGLFPLWFDYNITRMLGNFIIGGCLFAIYPLCISRIIDNTAEDYILTATAGALFFYGIGATIGPTLFAAVVSVTTPKLFYPFLGFFATLLMLIMAKSYFASKIIANKSA